MDLSPTTLPLSLALAIALGLLSCGKQVCRDDGSTRKPTDAGEAGYSVGGSVTGLADGDSLVLLNNDTDSITVSGSDFVFPTRLAEGAAYRVSVSAKPVGRACTVTWGDGTIRGADVREVTVICSTPLPSTYAQ